MTHGRAHRDMLIFSIGPKRPMLNQSSVNSVKVNQASHMDVGLSNHLKDGWKFQKMTLLKIVLTLVSSWALARLSTAMAKNTFSSVSVGMG